MGWVLSVYPIAVALLAVLILVLSPQVGVLALGAILLPHLCLAAVLLAPVAVLLRHRVLGVSLAILALVMIVLFGPDWFSLPRAADGRDTITVATWNTLARGTSPAEVVEGILASDAEIVGLQELTPDVASALDADPRIATRFPDRWFRPDDGVHGMGLLSTHPMTDLEAVVDPPAQVARVDLGAAGSVVVVNGHPLPGSWRELNGIPVSFDGRRRDADIGLIRELVDAPLASGQRVLVMGDYNVTPTQVGYRRLAEGLRDAHAEVGNGTGWTWRPRALADAFLTVIRIDYVLTSADLEPIGTELGCDVSGDHCLLMATLAAEVSR